MKFSSRTNWHSRPNKITQQLALLPKNKKIFYDLTVSNPLNCGLHYPVKKIVTTFQNRNIINYNPEPFGLLKARESVANYYLQKNIYVSPKNILLTASTSEAYSIVFKLLCNFGDNVLIPRPSYPLFEYLALLNDVRLRQYDLNYDGVWHINIESVKRSINRNTKAIVIINPHNPTGMFLKNEEYLHLKRICARHNLALIVDEVFSDYPLTSEKNRVLTTAGDSEVLTFTLNGISKMFGLPQMKLSWIVLSGKKSVVQKASRRLEIICDSYLSVNTPVQIALPKLFLIGTGIKQQILKRIVTNLSIVKRIVKPEMPISVLNCEGGWYCVVRVPKVKSDEALVLDLLNNFGVYVFPGYYFDLLEDGHLVISLLPKSAVFEKGMNLIAPYFNSYAC